MKKSHLYIIVFVGVLAFIIFRFYGSSPPIEANIENVPIEKQKDPTHTLVPKDRSKVTIAPLATPKTEVKIKTIIKEDNNFIPENVEEESLKQLSELVKISYIESSTKEQLLERLIELNLKPIHSIDKNPYTGSLSIIRTKKKLKGTRYIHAQFFEDENEKAFLQHMSFEFRPGTNAMQRAINAIKSTFNIEGKPQFKRDDFIGWKLPNGYIVWVKKLGKTDLKNDPYNAYTDKDIGTVKVALELEIHDGEGPKHLHN